MSVKSPVPLAVSAPDVRIGMARTLAAIDPLGIMPGVESLYLAEVDRLMQELDGVGVPDRFAEVLRVRYPDLTDRQLKRLWGDWRPVAVRKRWEPTFYNAQEARRFLVTLLVWLTAQVVVAAGAVVAVFYSLWIGIGVMIGCTITIWITTLAIRRRALRDPDPGYWKVREFHKGRIRGDGTIVAQALEAAERSPRLHGVFKALVGLQIIAGVVGTIAGIAIPWSG